MKEQIVYMQAQDHRETSSCKVSPNQYHHALKMLAYLVTVLHLVASLNCDIYVQATAVESQTDESSFDNSISRLTKEPARETAQLRTEFDRNIERRLDRLEFDLRKATHLWHLKSSTNSYGSNNSTSYSNQSIDDLTQFVVYLTTRLELVETFVASSVRKLYETEQRVLLLEQCDCRLACKWWPNGASDNATKESSPSGTAGQHMREKRKRSQSNEERESKMILKMDGETWHHKCDFCTCHRGQVKCRRYICPKPQCQEPIHEPNECCPVCYKSCVFGSQTIRHGGKLIRNGAPEACKECKCLDGRLKCQNVQTWPHQSKEDSISKQANAGVINPRIQRSTSKLYVDHMVELNEQQLARYEGEENNEEDDDLDSENTQSSDSTNRNSWQAHRARRQTGRSAHSIGPLVCPAADCEPDQQVRFTDDCCTYCKSFDFCSLAKAHGLCHYEASCLNNNSNLQLPSGSQTLAKAFECRCKQGYEGDGGNCRDIDECASSHLNNCDRKSTICLNQDGGFECKCKPGYRNTESDHEKGRRICLDIDECSNSSLNKCHREANCINLRGSYKCRCRPGFLGDGFECLKWVQPLKSSSGAAYLHRHSTSELRNRSINDIYSSEVDELDDEGKNPSDSDEETESYPNKLSDSRWDSQSGTKSTQGLTNGEPQTESEFGFPKSSVVHPPQRFFVERGNLFSSAIHNFFGGDQELNETAEALSIALDDSDKLSEQRSQNPISNIKPQTQARQEDLKTRTMFFQVPPRFTKTHVIPDSRGSTNVTEQTVEPLNVVPSGQSSSDLNVSKPQNHSSEGKSTNQATNIHQSSGFEAKQRPVNEPSNQQITSLYHQTVFKPSTLPNAGPSHKKGTIIASATSSPSRGYVASRMSNHHNQNSGWNILGNSASASTSILQHYPAPFVFTASLVAMQGFQHL